MELLIFSDSHGNARGMREVLLRQTKEPDGVFFLGDGLNDLDRVDFGNVPVYAACGNCDVLIANPPPTEGLISLGGRLIFYTHGHLYGVKSGTGAILKRAAEVGADIVLFGHTHRPTEEWIPAGTEIGGIGLPKPLILFNPGSIGYGGRRFGSIVIKGETILLSHGEL